MYTITKEFNFSASHQLFGLPDEHPCARLHGHNYTVLIELQAMELGPTGFVRDYRELAEFKTYLEEQIDHRHLNDLFGNAFVTAEHLAYLFFTWCKGRWPEVSAVRVSETPKTWAEYRP